MTPPTPATAVPVAPFNIAERRTLTADLVRLTGSKPLARKLVAGRPYLTLDTLLDAADAGLKELDRLATAEAVAAHPPLGGRTTAGSRPACEQSALQAGLDDATAAELRDLNDEYTRRHGHVFLYCASGRGPAEVLEELRRRLAGAPEDAWADTVEHLRRINRLRLTSYLGELAREAA